MGYMDLFVEHNVFGNQEEILTISPAHYIKPAPVWGVIQSTPSRIEVKLTAQLVKHFMVE